MLRLWVNETKSHTQSYKTDSPTLKTLGVWINHTKTQEYQELPFYSMDALSVASLALPSPLALASLN